MSQSNAPRFATAAEAAQFLEQVSALLADPRLDALGPELDAKCGTTVAQRLADLRLATEELIDEVAFARTVSF